MRKCGSIRRAFWLGGVGSVLLSTVAALGAPGQIAVRGNGHSNGAPEAAGPNGELEQITVELNGLVESMLKQAENVMPKQALPVPAFPNMPFQVQIAQLNGAQPNGGPVPFLKPKKDAQPGAPGEEANPFWIGLATAPVPGALRAHLNLPEGRGLLVQEIVPDSAAAKAKIAKYDVLLKAGDKPLEHVRDLLEAVRASAGKTIGFDLIRGGKPLHIDVTPTKRPTENVAQDLEQGIPGLDIDHEQIKKFLEGLRAGEGGQPPMRFRVFGPGAIVGGVPGVQPPLPDNVSVAITKEGGKPAKIVVRKGDQQWEVQENELDKLPADLRPFVKRMVGRQGPVNLDIVPEGGPNAAEIQRHREEIKRAQESARRVAKEGLERAAREREERQKQQKQQPDGVHRQLDQLAKSVEELRATVQRQNEELRRSLDELKKAK